MGSPNETGKIVYRKDPFVLVNKNPEMRQVVKFKEAMFKFQAACKELELFMSTLTITQVQQIKLHVTKQAQNADKYCNSVLSKLHQIDEKMYRNTKIGKMRKR